MLTFKLSDGSTLTVSLAVTSALVEIKQFKNGSSNAISIPLADVKEIVRQLKNVWKFFS